MRTFLLGAAAWVLAASPARAGETIVNPYAPTREPVVLDFSKGKIVTPPIDSGVAFEDLDEYMGRPVAVHPQGELPEGWVQEGSVVVPRAVAEGADVRSPGFDEITAAPRPSAADKVMGPDAGDLCLFPEATPGGIYTGEFFRGSEFPRHGTVYMNFTGGMMVSGGENSAINQSTLAKNGSTYPVYGGGETKAVAVAQAVQADFADVAVRVVYLKRPPKRLPYVMIMMGGHYSDTTAGPSGGVAPGADCEDQGMRNVCYAFVNGDPTTSQSNVASQEIGHTMGLGHTYGDDRVMAYGYDTNGFFDMGFGNECTTVLIAQGQSGYCSGVNKCHCGSDGLQQHDVRTLQAIYAPPGPDMIPPTIEITAPADGATFAKGETITVLVAPEDDYGGYGWDLVIRDANDEVLAEVVDYDVAQEFKFGGLPSGTYTLTATVQDHADQIGEHTITITVEGEAGAEETGAPPTTSASEGDASGEPGTSEGSGDSGESGSSGATSEQDGTDEGCSCATSGDPGLALLGLFGLLGIPRRTRRAL